MVASRESFSSLQYTNGPIIHMGDDTQIQAEGKGFIKLKHGVFNDVLYVPSLATNLLSIYHMTMAHQSEWYFLLTQWRYHISHLGIL